MELLQIICSGISCIASLNDKVEVDEHNMDMSSCGPEQHSIKKISEKIYAMLSDE